MICGSGQPVKGEAMKKWLISYTVRRVQDRDENGNPIEIDDKEISTSFNANSIQQALDLATVNIKDVMEMDRDVLKVAIWHIGMINDDVF